MKNKNIDKRKLEQNQNITKLYATSYAMLVYNRMHPEEDISEYGMELIEVMRRINPKEAVKKADALMKKAYKRSIKKNKRVHNCK